VPRAGVEPATCRLGGDRSIHAELPGQGRDYRAFPSRLGRHKGRHRYDRQSPLASLSVPQAIRSSKPNPDFKPNQDLTNSPS
jgi:hypothetical protein